MFQTDPYSFIVGLVVMSLLPFLAMVATSYLKIVVVVSLIRNALGIQSIPPNMVVNALALILTFYIMAPLVERGWTTFREESNGQSADVTYTTDAALKAAEPFREFLIKNSDERQTAFFVRTAETLWSTRDETTGEIKPAEVDEKSYFILVPAFCVSELTRAFEIGFLIYLPFIAIDIIISNILLAMGMMMVSPVTISLPFKLLLFVIVDGWTILIQGLVQSYIK
ncbi:MAG: type III secretion system export apparatus subunit SctR [Kiritimatiellae bacterium]|nr:type III secretion system export apparatus subunit SctR [Kiritimatiellia bacterium]